MNATPKPGIYEDVPFEDYCQWDAVNASRLKMMRKSPKHYKTSNFGKETKALRIGSLVHCGKLETLALAERYAVIPDYHYDEENRTSKGEQSRSKTTGYVKERTTKFIDANDGKQFVSRDEFEAMKNIVGSIEADKRSRDLLNELGQAELSILWNDPVTGILCKARIDKLSICPASGEDRLVDLKTTADLFGFERGIANYGYHIQAAHYQSGWATLNGGTLPPFYFVACETTPPYCVQCAPLDRESIEQGQEELEELMQKVAACHESGSWPGPQSPDTWKLPAWAIDTKPVALTVGGVAIEL